MEVLFKSSTKYYDYVLYKSYNLANIESDNRAFLWIINLSIRFTC